MLFKLKVSVPDVQITTEEQINVQDVSQDKNINITIRRIDEEEKENVYFDIQTICEAVVNIKLSKNAAPIIVAIWNKKLPDEYDLDSLPAYIKESYEKSGILEGYEIPKSSLPDSVQNLLNENNKMLIESILKVLGLASWKFAQNAPIYTYSYSRMEWSNDGIEWRMTPTDFIIDTTYRPPHFWKDNESAIQKFVDESKIEPLSQELFREAWYQRNLNPRSSLVIGITALETGVKELISNLIPDAEWLVMNVPSPPIAKIFEDYFPTLPIKLNGKTIQPSKEIIDQIKKWILKRNEIVHGKKINIDFLKLKEFLLLTRDLLYLCDYSRGEKWALENVRDSTIRNLVLNFHK